MQLNAASVDLAGAPEAPAPVLPAPLRPLCPAYCSGSVLPAPRAQRVHTALCCTGAERGVSCCSCCSRSPASSSCGVTNDTLLSGHPRRPLRRNICSGANTTRTMLLSLLLSRNVTLSQLAK